MERSGTLGIRINVHTALKEREKTTPSRRLSPLLLHGRDPKRGLKTVRKIKETTGNESIQFCRANLSSLREVDELARQVISGVTRLDVLVNNAGVGFGQDASKREVSQDGYELRFAVNYLVPYLLTEIRGYLAIIRSRNSAAVSR